MDDVPGTSAAVSSDVDALRVAEERLRAALHASNIGTFRFDIRRNRLDWADGFDRVFGTTANNTLEQFFEVIHPEDRAHVLAAYTRSVNEGADFEEEFRVIWPDGSIHWLHDRGRTSIGDDGKPHYIVGAITDVTNHKRLEQIIRERDAQFRTLANAIPQLAWIADIDGNRLWFNDRWLEYCGYTLDEVQGLGWMRIHDATIAAGVLERQRAAFRSGAVWEETVPLRRKDGRYRWFLSRAMPVPSPDGTTTQWVGTHTDITEQRVVLHREQAARLQAEQATALRQQVLGFVAHDLRNPLHTIVMASGMLLDLPLSDEQRRQQLELIKRCAWGMDRLIGDLLDVSRIEAGTLSVRREPIPVPAIVSEVMAAFQDGARARGVSLESEIATELPVIHADQQRIVQALGNLVNNAIRFTAAGGSIVLGAHHTLSHVQIVVRDTGSGIAPENLGLIFDRFWQADRTGGGAGLGLAIAKGIVESHDGMIRVDSEPGRGTTFTVHLPHGHGGSATT